MVYPIRGLFLVSLATAQRFYFNKGPFDEAPWQEPYSELESSLQKDANASGLLTVPGPDLSKPTGQLPGPNAEEWQWKISVSDHVPFSDSPESPKDDGQGPFYYTGGEIVLSAPRSPLGSGNGSANGTRHPIVDDSWEMCLLSWDLSFSDVPFPDVMRSDNGTCESVLSTECIRDLIDSATPENSTRCACPVLSAIPSCQSLGNATDVFTKSNCEGKLYDADMLRSSNGSIIASWDFGSGAYHAGNETAYNDLGTLAWPFLISFNNKDGTSGTEATNLGSLRCVRAMEPTEGSTEPMPPAAETPPSTGSHIAGLSWSLVAGVIVFSLMCTS